MNTHVTELRAALLALPDECRKPWRQLDGLPYLHATDDPEAKPYSTPVVGRFDYLQTMQYIAACNPVAIAKLLEDSARLDALERMVRTGKVELAVSLMGTGFEVGHWTKRGITAKVYNGSLRDTIDGAASEGRYT